MSNDFDPIEFMILKDFIAKTAVKSFNKMIFTRYNNQIV